MSCFGCNKKYGLFCKEYGCPNCGYSYCAKCLKRPAAVPKHNQKVLHVCLICYDKLSKLQEVEKVIDVDTLPGTIITKTNRGAINEQIVHKDINALLEVEPSAAFVGEILEPISPAKLYTSTHSSAENSDITDNLDSAILQRLKNLKAHDPSSFPSDDALRARLSKLNGMPQKDYSKKDLLLNTDQRSDQEKMNDLLAQFMGEVKLDKRLETEGKDTLSDIERRLKALRDDPVSSVVSGTPAATTTSPDTNTPSDNELDDETMLKSIMEKYLAEARLPEAPSNLETELAAGIPDPPPGADTEELPWCNICNEDATLRCKGCDGELFCAQCFRECHDDDEEYRTHAKEPYSAPPKFKEDHF